MNSMIRALVSTGVAISTSTLVTIIVQTRIGIRKRVIPGARILKIVTRKLMAPEDRARAHQHERHDPQVLPVADRGERPVLRQRRVARPAGRGRATGHEPEEEQDPAERQHPERQRVDPREGHVRRADLERHDVVPEARQDRDDEQEDHRRGVHREQLVVRLVGHELEPGLGELDAHDQRQQAGEEEEDERVDQVEDPDLLVIGGRQPLVQAGPVATGGGRERMSRHRLLLTRRSACRSCSGEPSRRSRTRPAGSGGTS